MAIVLSKPLSVLQVAQESAFGTAPSTVYKRINTVGGPPEFALEQEMIEEDEGVRTGLIAAPPVGGRKGGGGPKLTLPLVAASATRATAATVFAPEDWAKILFQSALGEGADVETGATEDAVGSVSGGSTVVTATEVVAATPARVDTITVTTGHGSRFAAGKVYIVVHQTTGVAYAFQVTNVATDTLTIYGGPLVATGIDAGAVIYGGWSMQLPGQSGDSELGQWSLALEGKALGDTTYYRLTGCNGNLMAEIEAGGEGKLTFDLQHSAWEANVATAASGSPAYTAWPAGSRQRIMGASGRVRLGVADSVAATAPATANRTLDATTRFSKVVFDAGLGRAAIDDVNSAEGRAGRVATEAKPTVTLTGYADITRYADLPSGGARGTTRAFSAVFGDATRGFFFIFMRAAALVKVPTQGDSSGLRTHELVLVPVDDESGFPSLQIGFA